MKALTFAVSLALVSILLSACGFQLRGESSGGLLPDQTAAVQIEVPLGERTMQSALENQLALANAQFSSVDADFSVRVITLETDQRTLTLASNLQAASRSVERTVQAVLTDLSDGNSRVVDLSARSSYDYARDNPAASDHEVALLESELDERLARQIVDQLRLFARRQP